LVDRSRRCRHALLLRRCKGERNLRTHLRQLRRSVPRRLTKPKREKPQGGSSPHCGHPGQSKNRYSNHAGVLSIEHPVPKMDSVQLPERDVPQHCCPNANMARLAAPKPPGCRFNCGSERRECRCAPKPFWRIGTLAVLPSFSDALLQGHSLAPAHPIPLSCFLVPILGDATPKRRSAGELRPQFPAIGEWLPAWRIKLRPSGRIYLFGF